MNIDNVYIAKIYNIIDMSWDYKNHPTLRIKEKQDVLIYIKIDENGDRHYIDLQTGNEYYTYSQLINHKYAIEYIEIQNYYILSKILGTKRKNMSKRRILKRYEKGKIK